MALEIMERPTAIPQPNTWADLGKLINRVVPGVFCKQFMEIRAGSHAQEFTELENELRTIFDKRVSAKGNPEENLPAAFQLKAARMLSLMGILQPEPEAAPNSGTALTVTAVVKRVMAAMRAGVATN